MLTQLAFAIILWPTPLLNCSSNFDSDRALPFLSNPIAPPLPSSSTFLRPHRTSWTALRGSHRSWVSNVLGYATFVSASRQVAPLVLAASIQLQARGDNSFVSKPFLRCAHSPTLVSTLTSRSPFSWSYSVIQSNPPPAQPCNATNLIDRVTGFHPLPRVYHSCCPSISAAAKTKSTTT